MSQTDESGEKTHEPSERKLEDARKRGDVARSDEVTTLAVYTGVLVAAATGVVRVSVPRRYASPAPTRRARRHQRGFARNALGVAALCGTAHGAGPCVADRATRHCAIW